MTPTSPTPGSARPWRAFVPCPYCKAKKDRRALCYACDFTGNLRVVQENEERRREHDGLERHIAGPLW